MALVLAPAVAGCSSGDPAPAVPLTTAAAPATSAAVPTSSTRPQPPATEPPSAAVKPSTPRSLSTAALNAFSACMRRHGVEVPPNATESWTPAPGTDKAKSQKAILACLNNLVSPS
jgi:hypothetical protein